MLSSHRNYISTTQEELEKAAGRMLIMAKTAAGDNAQLFRGASAALYVLAEYELKDEADFLNVFTMVVADHLQEGDSDE